MAGSRKSISTLSKRKIVTRIVLGMITAPLLIVLYLLCWVRVKLTALIYCNRRRTLVSGKDIISVMDIDNVNSIINVIILTRGSLSLDAMKELFLTKVLTANDANNRPLFPKFTRYIELCAGYLMWTEESNFNLDDHIKPYCDQPANDEEQLKTVINELFNKPLPSLKSGWEIIVIPLEYRQSDAPKTCILFRANHFITDGISILRLIIEQMAGNHGVYQPILKRMQNKFKPPFNNPILNLLSSLATFVYNYVFKDSVDLTGHGNHVFMKDKSKSCMLGETGYIEWTSAVKMDTVRHIRSATSATVNDVLMSCMAGAFRKYFVRHDICPPDVLTTVVPVSIHGPDDPVEASNEIYCMSMSMPTGDMDCLQRLKVTKVEMDKLKCSPDNIISRCLQHYCYNTLPYTVIKKMAGNTEINVAFSNMPGPTSKASFNGNTIVTMAPMQLLSHRLGFTVAIFTYSGDVTVAVTVDRARVCSRDDLRQLLDDFVEEVQQLYNSVVGLSNKPSSTAMEKKTD